MSFRKERDGYHLRGSPEPLFPCGSGSVGLRHPYLTAVAKCHIDLKEASKTLPNHLYQLYCNQQKPRFMAEHVLLSGFHN